MVKPSKKLFIDTNVLAHYMILKNIKEAGREDKKLNDSYTRYEQAHNLIKKYLSNELKDCVFLSSYLVEAELHNSIKEEYKYYRVYESGAPVSSLKFEMNKSLSKKDAEEIDNDIFFFVTDNFVVPYKNKDLEGREHNKIMSRETIYDLDIIIPSILELNLGTQDSILISTAIAERCDYFVTSDKKLLEKNKEFSDIEIISPQKAIEAIQSEK